MVITKLTAAMLIPGALAQFSSSSWGGFAGEGALFMPISAGDVQWRYAYEDSNATANYTFTGRDVTKPYPGSPQDGWTMSITALDLSPVEMGWDFRLAAPRSLYKAMNPDTMENQTEAEFVRLAGGNIIPNVDPSWIVCNWLGWGASSYSGPANETFKDVPSKPDGDCGEVLSAECIKGIEEAAAKSWHTLDGKLSKNDFNIRAGCDGFEVPKACGDGNRFDFPSSTTDTFFPKAELPIRYLTGKTTNLNGYTFRKPDDKDDDLDPKPEDAPKIFKSMYTDYVFVVNMFGHYVNTTNTNNTIEPGFTKLSCIRPELKGATHDSTSTTGKDDKKNAAVPVSSPLALIMAVAGLMVASFL